MRLDLFLKKTCILRQRSVAKTVCDAGAVRVNGHPAKAAQMLRPGDEVRVSLARRELLFRVVDLPHGNVAKRDAHLFIEILNDTPRDAFSHIFEAEDDAEDAAGDAAGDDPGHGDAAAEED